MTRSSANSDSRDGAAPVRYDGEALFHRVADTLVSNYGNREHSPDLPLSNKQDPLDELIFIMLTVMTQFGVDAVFANLKGAYPDWRGVLAAPEEELAAVLQPIGLYAQRARRLKELITEVVRREGTADLSRLHNVVDDREVEDFLASLPGVGKKVARCVMLYSLGRNVFPVDAHVLRVMKRLGLAEPDLTLSRAQDVLQEHVPEYLRYTLHVNLVVHGRTICNARRPRCGKCVLSARCPSATNR